MNVRMVARTLPGKQFEVGRELRARVAVAFQREGIFLAVLTLYLEVRPAPAGSTSSSNGSRQAGPPQPTASARATATSAHETTARRSDSEAYQYLFER